MPDADTETRTAFRTCPLCEASCGLEITLRPDGAGGETVQRIRGDRLDVFSKGFLCPKGSTLKQLHEDPDRLRQPMVKRDGVQWTAGSKGVVRVASALRHASRCRFRATVSSHASGRSGTPSTGQRRRARSSASARASSAPARSGVPAARRASSRP